MANTSILTAFERMWHHITAKLGDKASKTEAQNYALDAANAVKNDLLNGAGGAYDTLKELGDLIDDNVDAIDALETVASSKANAVHTHTVANITDLTTTATELNYMDGVTSNVQAQLDSKLSTSGGTISGVITTTDGDAINRNINTSGTHIYGGVDYDNGATLSAYGKDHSSYAGYFRLRAKDGSTFTALEGRPDGTLKWGGNNVLTVDRTGVLPIADGGTGAATATDALQNLGITATATELNYMDGVTSNVQAQLDGKLSTSGGTMTGTITMGNNTLAERDVDNSGVIIVGGTDFSNSASVAVYGKDQSSYAGRFRLTADNGEETCVLEGRPNGTLKWDGKNVLTNDDKTEIQTQLDNKVSKFGSTMTGNLEIQNNREQSPVLTISGTANESGRRASTYIVKAANSTSNGGTEITDKAFDSSTTSLVINKSSGAISHRLTLRDMDSNYQITNYLIYGEHNKPSPEDIGAVSKADQRWNLLYDSGEISAIANSISNIDVSGYTNIQVLVRIYNDGDSINSRAGSAIFTCENGKTYQFPVWSNMFSKSINTVYTMATFNLVDGWLVCPYASRLIGDATTFEDTEGGTAGSLAPTGSGMMKCTSPLSTLTISSLDQNSNYYFGMGSRVIVWGWN